MMRAAVTIAATVCILGGTYLWGARAEERIERLEREVGEMQTLTTTWTSGGATHTVSTPRADGESLADWRKRHAEAVAAMQELYPPDGK